MEYLAQALSSNPVLHIKYISHLKGGLNLNKGFFVFFGYQNLLNMHIWNRNGKKLGVKAFLFHLL